ncbi:MAG: cysteine hydrolase [Actinobacteria bacterium]|nr:cysteine hydrolase [Actinomycetota bacterium]
MQRVFAEDGSPWVVPGCSGLIPAIGRLVDAFGDRVVFTRFVPFDAPPGPGSWADYYALHPFFLRPEAERLTHLVEPFASRNVPILAAPTFSKYGAGLEALAGPDRTIVLCGVATDCCVISTALPATDAGLRVRVVRDACAGMTPEAHEAALAIMGGYEGHIGLTTVAEELGRR